MGAEMRCASARQNPQSPTRSSSHLGTGMDCRGPFHCCFRASFRMCKHRRRAQAPYTAFGGTEALVWQVWHMLGLAGLAASSRQAFTNALAHAERLTMASKPNSTRVCGSLLPAAPLAKAIVHVFPAQGSGGLRASPWSWRWHRTEPPL